MLLMPSTQLTWMSASCQPLKLTQLASTFLLPAAVPAVPSVALVSHHAPPSRSAVRSSVLLSRVCSTWLVIWLVTISHLPVPAHTLQSHRVWLRPRRRPSAPVVTFSRLVFINYKTRLNRLNRSQTQPFFSHLAVAVTGPMPVVSSTTRPRTSSSGLTRRTRCALSPCKRVLPLLRSSTVSPPPPRVSRRSSRRRVTISCTTTISAGSWLAHPTWVPVSGEFMKCFILSKRSI